MQSIIFDGLVSYPYGDLYLTAGTHLANKKLVATRWTWSVIFSTELGLFKAE
jgi:hypothetical protein